MKQGELGRTYALTHVNEIKLALTEVKSNFESQTKAAISDEKNGDAPVFTLDQKK